MFCIVHDTDKFNSCSHCGQMTGNDYKFCRSCWGLVMSHKLEKCFKDPARCSLCQLCYDIEHSPSAPFPFYERIFDSRERFGDLRPVPPQKLPKPVSPQKLTKPVSPPQRLPKPVSPQRLPKPVSPPQKLPKPVLPQKLTKENKFPAPPDSKLHKTAVEEPRLAKSVDTKLIQLHKPVTEEKKKIDKPSARDEEEDRKRKKLQKSRLVSLVNPDEEETEIPKLEAEKVESKTEEQVQKTTRPRKKRRIIEDDDED